MGPFPEYTSCCYSKFGPSVNLLDALSGAANHTLDKFSNALRGLRNTHARARARVL